MKGTIPLLPPYAFKACTLPNLSSTLSEVAVVQNDTKHDLHLTCHYYHGGAPSGFALNGHVESNVGCIMNEGAAEIQTARSFDGREVAARFTVIRIRQRNK